MAYVEGICLQFDIELLAGAISALILFCFSGSTVQSLVCQQI